MKPTLQNSSDTSSVAQNGLHGDGEQATAGIASLVARCPTIPSLPSVYARLMGAMEDPYSSAADFAKIMEDDAGVTARVLKLVNSPLFTISGRVDSVGRAMSILGVEQLHDLILATSTVSAFNNVPPDLVDMSSFWRHSLGTAVACRSIGLARADRNVGGLFVAGLLHDVGRLVMYMADPDGARQVLLRAQESGELLCDVERQEFGFDHAGVGRFLLSQWGLASSLCEPVGYHHEPRNVQRFRDEIATVHVADIIAHGLLFGSSGASLVPPLSVAAWFRLEGDKWFTARLTSEIDRQFEIAKSIILNESP